MKKLFALLAIVAVMVACGQKQANVIVDTDTVAVDTTEEVVEVVDTIDVDEVLAE